MDRNLIESQIVSLDLLEPNKGQIRGVPRNPRFIRDAAFLKLKKSIEADPEMLAMREILVYPLNGKYIIIGGNMRYRALKELGETSCIVKVIPPETTPEQLTRITLKDNSGFGEWDIDLLTEEWDKKLLDDCCIELSGVDEVLGNPTQEAQEDDFNEEEDEVETICKTGDLWQLGNHRLMCGDSTKAEDVKKLMQGELADLWLTDPPYNVDYSSKNEALNAADKGNRIQKNIANDTMSQRQFHDFLDAAFRSASCSLKPGGAYYVWYASKEAVNFRTVLSGNKLEPKQEIVWCKNCIVLGRQDYQWKHELCLYGWKEGAPHYFTNRRNEETVIPDAEELDIDKMKKSDMQALLHKIFDSNIPTSVIDEKKPQKSELHPTMKPVRLFGRLIDNSSRKGEIVLDTFGGSGTTMIACEQLGRRCRMMELDPHYCDVIIARWEKLTGNKAEKL